MVSVITCTIRDSMMENVFQNFNRQNYKVKELIIILNNDKMNITKWKKRARKHRNISVYRIPETETLGDCLNFGIEKARFDIVAKFDDDDYYTQFYLSEAMNVFHENKEIQLVGKGISFLYFEKDSLLTLYKNGTENRFGYNFLKGGTLIFKKNLYPDIKFPSQTGGEDSEFRKACKRKGVKMYTTSRYNYVWIRRAKIETHTYQLPESEFMKKCEIIQTIENFQSLVTKEFY